MTWHLEKWQNRQFGMFLSKIRELRPIASVTHLEQHTDYCNGHLPRAVNRHLDWYLRWILTLTASSNQRPMSASEDNAAIDTIMWQPASCCTQLGQLTHEDLSVSWWLQAYLPIIGGLGVESSSPLSSRPNQRTKLQSQTEPYLLSALHYCLFAFVGLCNYSNCLSAADTIQYTLGDGTDLETGVLNNYATAELCHVDINRKIHSWVPACFL